MLVSLKQDNEPFFFFRMLDMTKLCDGVGTDLSETRQRSWDHMTNDVARKVISGEKREAWETKRAVQTYVHYNQRYREMLLKSLSFSNRIYFYYKF